MERILTRKKKQEKKIKVRLPMEAVKILKTKGGPQSLKKGKKGYNKKKERQKNGELIKARRPNLDFKIVLKSEIGSLKFFIRRKYDISK